MNMIQEANQEEKYSTDNYIAIYKFIPANTRWEIIDNPYFGDSEYKIYKLIHKKHKDILYEYLENNKIDIEVSRKGVEPWVYQEKFIKNYREDFSYRLEIITPSRDTLKRMIGKHTKKEIYYLIKNKGRKKCIKG